MLTNARPRRRAGFTLVEIMIALAILALLAAMLYPTAASQLRSGRSTALANQLDNLRQAIANYRENVQRYPKVLTQLTNQPVAGALESCSGALPGPLMARWRGPYLTQNIVGNMPVADATIQNLLVRNPPDLSTGQAGLLQIGVLDVDLSTANDLEARFDGDANFSTGTILWSLTGADIGTLTFQIGIRGC
jgi:general secretion pathway protein G